MNQYKQLAINLQTVFEENSTYLCQLDANAGDGDHGLTISRGFTAAAQKVKTMDDKASPAEIFKTIGYEMLASMGGASGPIFSTLFIQAAIALKDGSGLTADNLKSVLEESIDAICDLADTKPGEKTMIDALNGAVNELVYKPASSLSEALSAAKDGAIKGAESTIDMIATKGRAKFMGERSRGFLDAGSWSVALIITTMADTLK